MVSTMFLFLGAMFLDLLLKLFQFLAQLRRRVLCGIGFLSAFLGSAEFGFFHSVFLILTTIFCIVHSTRMPMLLAEVAMLLKASFLCDSGRRLSTRSFVSFLALAGSFLVGLFVGLFLCTYALHSLKRHKKQMDVYGSLTFLVKVELVLPRKWAHPKNVTFRISLMNSAFMGIVLGLALGP
jgi:hypothetical protein